MSLQRQIDSLIEAGWDVIESDFSPMSIERWRSQAFDCVTHMVGPDHGCARYFEECVNRAGSDHRLTTLAKGAIQIASVSPGREIGGENN